MPVGSIQEVTLARILHDRADPEEVRVADVMARPLPHLDVSTQLDEAYRLLLAGNTGVLAVADGVVQDIVTRIDLVQYWNQKSKPQRAREPMAVVPSVHWDPISSPSRQP
jgi:cystathionine beta-synthase